MATKNHSQPVAQIENTPPGGARSITCQPNPRNRPAYFTLLKSISDVKGDPRAVGATWKWTFRILGVDLEGTGRCLKHEPGKLYSFKTEGGIESTFTYKAEPSGKGTKLIIELEYTVPEKHKSILPIDSVARVDEEGGSGTRRSMARKRSWTSSHHESRRAPSLGRHARRSWSAASRHARPGGAGPTGADRLRPRNPGRVRFWQSTRRRRNA